MRSSHSNYFGVLLVFLLLATPIALANDLRPGTAANANIGLAFGATPTSQGAIQSEQPYEVFLPEIVSVRFRGVSVANKFSVRSVDLDSVVVVDTINSPSYVSLSINDITKIDREAPYEFTLQDFSLVQGNTYRLQITAHDRSDAATDVERMALQVAPSQPCTLVGVSWDQRTALDGETVGFTVEGSGYCDQQLVDVRIIEDDFFVDDRAASAPRQLRFSDGKASGSWVAQGEDDASGNPEYYLFASLAGGSSIRSSDLLIVERPEAQVAPQIRRMMLVGTGSSYPDLRALKNGGTYTVNRQDLVSEFTVRADATAGTESVQFRVNKQVFQTENREPYVLTGDLDGDYQSWVVPDGVYTVEAIPYTLDQASGVAGQPYSVTLEIVNENPAPNIAPELSVDLETPLVNVGETVYISVDATDSDGTINRVELQHLGEIKSVSDPNFRFDFVAENPGIHSIQVTAFDDDGASTTEVVELEVRAIAEDPVPNIEPIVKVQIRPNPVEVGQEFIIDVDPSDPDGTITRVAVGLPGEVIELEPPYELARTVYVVGEYPVYIHVEDDGGAVKSAYTPVTVVEATPQENAYLSWVAPVEGHKAFVNAPLELQVFLMNSPSVDERPSAPPYVQYTANNEKIATGILGDSVYWIPSQVGNYELRAYLEDDSSVTSNARSVAIAGAACVCPSGYECTSLGCVPIASDDEVLGNVNRLTLFDADTGKDLRVLNPGEELILSNIHDLQPGQMLNVRADVSDSVDSVEFEYNGQSVTVDRNAPYHLYGGDVSVALVPNMLEPGYHTIAATATTDGQATERYYAHVQINPAVKPVEDVQEEITGIFLVDGSTGEKLYELSDGGAYTLTETRASAVDFLAETNGKVGSVYFSLRGYFESTDNSEPFHAYSLSNSRLAPLALTDKTYSLAALAYARDNGLGDLLDKVNLDFTVSIERAQLPQVDTLPEAPLDLSVDSVWLTDASTGDRIAQIQDGSVLSLTERQAANVDLRAYTSADTESVFFEIDGVLQHVDNIAPYMASAATSLSRAVWQLDAGRYSLTATPYSGDNTKGEAGPTFNADFTVKIEQETVAVAPSGELETPSKSDGGGHSSAVVGFTVVDAATGEALASFSSTEFLDGDYDDYSFAGRTINIRADVTGSPESVEFAFNDDPYTVDNAEPFLVTPDSPGTFSYFAYRPGMLYSLTATPFSADKAQGEPGKSLTADFEFS